MTEQFIDQILASSNLTDEQREKIKQSYKYLYDRLKDIVLKIDELFSNIEKEYTDIPKELRNIVLNTIVNVIGCLLVLLCSEASSYLIYLKNISVNFDDNNVKQDILSYVIDNIIGSKISYSVLKLIKLYASLSYIIKYFQQEYKKYEKQDLSVI